MPASPVSFIGLGVMGYPMAGHLARNGHDVTVYNRTAEKAAKWVAEYGGKSAPTPEQAVKDAAIAFTCVGNDEDLKQVINGKDGVLSGLAQGTILVDHTTASADLARKIHGEAAALGIGFLDAPVSGGQAGAQNGALSVMVGGDKEVFERARETIECYGKAVTLMGPSGAGQLTKMVNQICVAGILEGLGEGLAFAKAAGLDGEKVVDVISQGAAQSWQMDNRAKTMLEGEFDFGFAVDWMLKDLDICLDEANNNHAALPVTRIIRDYYSQLQKNGHGRKDTSSLILRLDGEK